MCNDGMRCTACGAAVGQEDRFCRICGLPVRGGARVNEHRFVTALFSDLTQYTRLTSVLDPEELKAVMEEIFLEAVRIVSSYDGEVEKFLGDAVVALFGVHRIHEDDLIRAVRSASAIHGFVEDLGRRLPLGEPAGLSMHTGIHAGTALVDDAPEVPLYQSVIGMPIIIAQRLSTLAAPGEILVGGASRREVERFFHLDFLGDRQLKGVADPLPVCRVGRARRTPLGVRRPWRSHAPMVGRQEQLEVLLQAFEPLGSGTGAVVLVTGDAGVGKSRLADEFLRLLSGDALAVTSQCLDHMKETPYYPVVSLVDRLVEYLDQDGSGRSLEDRLPSPRHGLHLQSLLGSRQGTNDLMPDVWKAEVCEAVSALIRVCARGRRLVVAVEDFHWADATTRDLFSYLLQEEDALGCLFLVVSREAVPLPPRGIHLHLGEIRREHVDTLLESLTGIREIPEDTADALYRITGGNPLYLQEYVSYLAEKGVPISGIAGMDCGDRVPETILGLLSARMENLGKDRKRLLQEASILGMVFSRDLLQAVTSVGAEAAGLLDDLEEKGFLERTRDGGYHFRHALMRDAATATLLKRHRRQLHRKVGSCLERISKSRAEHCGMIAYHLYHAGEYARAVPYFILAARTCQAEGSWMEAAAQYRKALDCLLRDETIPGRDELLVDVREGTWTCSRVFDPDQAMQALQELTGHYAESGRESLELFSRIRLINLYSQKARFADALELYREVSPRVEGNTLLAAAAKTAVAYTYTFLGQPAVALGYLQEARGTLESSDRFLAAVNSLTTLAAWVWRGGIRQAFEWYARTKGQSSAYMDLDLMAEVWHAYLLFLKGEILPGQALLEYVKDREKKLGSLAGGVSYLRVQSAIYLYSRYTGQVDRACRELDALEALRHDHTRIPGLMGLYRAWTALGSGDHARARDLAQECLPLLEAGVANRVPYALNVLAESLVMLGDFPAALDAGKRCIDFNERNGNAEQLAWALRNSAVACLKAGDPDAAQVLLKRAAALARDQAMKPHMAWTLAAWGDLHASLGAWRKARACYRRSAVLWNKMGVPENARQAESALEPCPRPD